MVLPSGLFKLQECKYLNYCRLFLRISTVSDMYNASGTAIAEGIYEGYCSTSQSFSLVHEPLQERPNEKTWSLWRRFLRSIMRGSGHGYQMVSRLGTWYPGLSSQRRWPYYFLVSCNALFRYTEAEYVEHERIGPNLFSEQGVTAADLPNDCVPVDATDVDNSWFVLDLPVGSPSGEEWSPVRSFAEYLWSFPKHEAVLLQRFEICLQLVQVVTGSFTDHSGVQWWRCSKLWFLWLGYRP
jgi:hypothetical protein